MGDNGFQEAIGIGSINLQLKIGLNSKQTYNNTIILNDVLHILGVVKNLISINQLMEQGNIQYFNYTFMLVYVSLHYIFLMVEHINFKVTNQLNYIH